MPFALSHVPGPSGTFWLKGVLGPGDVCLIRTIAILYLSCAAAALLAQNPAAKAPATGVRVPVITDTEFNAAIPSLDDAPLESIDAWQADQENRAADGSAAQQVAQTAADPAILAVQDNDLVE